MNQPTLAEKMRAVREFIREPYAWPGGYPKTLLFADGQVCCADCAKENYRLIRSDTKDNYRGGWQVEAVQIFWEGPVEFCAHCECPIESAYGDPDSDQDQDQDQDNG